MGVEAFRGTETFPGAAANAALCGKSFSGDGNDDVHACPLGKKISALASGRQPDISFVHAQKESNFTVDQRPCTGKEQADKVRGEFRLFSTGFSNGRGRKSRSFSVMQRRFLA